MAACNHPARSGFTLVELMVALAVLAIIVVVAANMMGAATTLTTVNNKHNDANDQARSVFDRIADDFSEMVRRKDVDYLFWKNYANGGSQGSLFNPNDVMYFFTEGAGYFDATTFGAGIPSGSTNNSEKDSFSLVGYRVNANPNSPDYNQLQRLGKPLSWDGGAYNSSSTLTQNSRQPNFMVFLNYPPVGNDVINGPSYKDTTGIAYSAAYFNSTFAGAYGNSGTPGAPPSVVGTQNGGANPDGSTDPGGFLGSCDSDYRSVGSQVFRFEYAFQLKDGTMSDKPVMAKTAANGLPSSYLSQPQRPLPSDDSNNTNGDGKCSVGTRWFDTQNQIGYICLDATAKSAIWHEIGIQDISAIIVTIAVLDKQSLYLLKSQGGDPLQIALALPDYSPTTAVTTSAMQTGDPAYLLDPTNPNGWAYALLPGQAVSQVASPSKLSQKMISQIRIYQRSFYLNTF